MLTHPLQPLPQSGETREVAPGVHWLRMPLSMGLNHINLWLLEDVDGWTLADTGMHAPICVSTWQQVITGLMAPRPAARVICTDLHPDHIGMAGWLTERFECRLWMNRMEYQTRRLLISQTAQSVPNETLRFYTSMGWSDAALEHYRSRFGAFGELVYRMPDSCRIEGGIAHRPPRLARRHRLRSFARNTFASIVRN